MTGLHTRRAYRLLAGTPAVLFPAYPHRMTKNVNVVKGKQGFQPTERAEPSNIGLPNVPTRVTNGDTITSTCGVCGEVETVPNKGLGRAKIAAWETRHQH